jgi:hypothetical protein
MCRRDDLQALHLVKQGRLVHIRRNLGFHDRYLRDGLGLQGVLVFGR